MAKAKDTQDNKDERKNRSIPKKADYILDKDCITFRINNKKELRSCIYDSPYIFGVESDVYCKIIKKACLEILPKLCNSIIANNYLVKTKDYLAAKQELEEFINDTLISDFERMKEDLESIFTESMIYNLSDKIPANGSSKKDREKNINLTSYIHNNFSDELSDSGKLHSLKDVFYKFYSNWYSGYIGNKKGDTTTIHFGSNDKSTYEEILKLHAYSNLPLYKREHVVFYQTIQDMTDDLYIDSCSERFYVKIKEEGSETYIPFINVKDKKNLTVLAIQENDKSDDLAVQEDSQENETDVESILFPWIDIRSCISSKDARTSSNYCISISEDLYQAFTEDYNFRPMVKLSKKWYSIPKDGTYSFHLKEGQDEQEIINYFISLIIRKGLTDATLEIVEEDSKTTVYTLTSEQCKNLFSALSAEQPHPDS